MTYYNIKTRFTASVMGMLIGWSGIINHGIFEILQGDKSTNGFFIEAIGEAHRFWVYGTEGAFTLIHNYLITGVLTILVSVAIIVWALKYIHLKFGTTVFLLLAILLILVGGGLGFIIVFIPTWAFATRINKSLSWWNKVISPRYKKILSSLWFYSFGTMVVLWLIVMELGIYGYLPGQNNPEIILNVIFVILFFCTISICITFICAIASDINSRKSGKSKVLKLPFYNFN